MGKLAELAAALAPEIEEKPKSAAAPKAESKKDKFEQLRDVEKALNKQLNTTMSIVRLGDKVGVPVPSISTGAPSLDDNVLGCGGLPRGRLIEIYGPESSGKTTLCLHIIAREQKNTENLCAIIDVEHALDPTYAEMLGVNVDELLVSQPSSGEDALETVEALIDSKLVSLIVVDSVAALVPKAELDGEMGDSNMGLQARLMSQACRKLVGKASQNNVTVIFINQLRDKIGVMFGSPEVTTGGKALKFYASVRLDVRRKEVIGEKDHPVGHVLKVKAAKNKCGCPMRETFINLMYDSGIDIYADLIEVAVKSGVITKKGAWYSFGEISLGNGLTNAGNYVRVNPSVEKEIRIEYSKALANETKNEPESR